MPVADLDLSNEPVTALPPAGPAREIEDVGLITRPYSQEETRENTRGDLARGLLWLLTFAIGGVLMFIGLGRLDGTVLTQSIFPSLIALAGTALGFYFGSQTARESAKEPGSAGGTTNPSGSSSGSRSNVARPSTAP
jgi:hypothetical protein